MQKCYRVICKTLRGKTYDIIGTAPDKQTAIEQTKIYIREILEDISGFTEYTIEIHKH